MKYNICCGQILKNKIEYVVKTFNTYLGDDNGKELSLLYTDSENYYGDYDIIIKSDPYASEYFSGCEILPSEKIKYYDIHGENVPVLFSNDSKECFNYDYLNKKLIINIDIFASSFYFLSLWQEYISNDLDVHERHSAKNSLQYKLNFIKKPIVTIYFNFAKNLIEKHFNLKFRERQTAVVMTHDIDYIRKWSPGIIYREMIQYFILNRLQKNLPERLKRLKAFFNALSRKNDPYRYSLEKMIDFEMERNVRSTFFIKAGTTSKHDVSYSLKNRYLNKCISKLKENFFDIGLHPSYHTFNNKKNMTKELNRLEKAFDMKVFVVRQHFLRYSSKTTADLHTELGFKYDSSLGYHDHEGYRTGFSYPHNLYNIKNDRMYDIIEVPLVIMDATLEFYRKMSPELSFQTIKNMISSMMNYGGVITILIHNTCYDELDYEGWGRVYEETIDYALEQNIPVYSISGVINSYYGNKSRL